MHWKKINALLEVLSLYLGNVTNSYLHLKRFYKIELFDKIHVHGQNKTTKLRVVKHLPIKYFETRFR